MLRVTTRGNRYRGSGFWGLGCGGTGTGDLEVFGVHVCVSGLG